MPEHSPEIHRLVEQAKEDPELLHRLVFEPEEAVAELDYLTRREKGMIVGYEPEDFVENLVNPFADDVSCGFTCLITWASSDEEIIRNMDDLREVVDLAGGVTPGGTQFRPRRR